MAGQHAASRHGLLPGLNYTRRLIAHVVKEDKEASCIHVVCVLPPQWRAKTGLYLLTLSAWQWIHRYIQMKKKNMIATGDPIWPDTEETTGNLCSY